MRPVTAADLASANLAYREPALYDELLADATVADDVLAAVDSLGIEVGSVLDLGCGTGRTLADLRSRRGWSVTGVDLQPDLLGYARRTYGLADVHEGDVRTVRLARDFDLVLCVGNTLSYLQAEDELIQALDTIAVHCRPGALVGIVVLESPHPHDGRIVDINSAVTGPASVETTTGWDESSGLLTTCRTWRFPHGRREHDHMVRRVWPATVLRDLASTAGLTEIDGDRRSGLMLFRR